MGSTITDTIDVNRLCIYELYRRIFPAIRSSGLLQLTSSTNSSPSNGQIWYDSGTNTFKFYQNGATATLSGGSSALSGLSDVNISEGSGIDGQVLYWKNSDTKWETKVMSLANLSGVLQVVSGSWQNQQLNASQLGDMLISSPSGVRC